MIYKFQSGERVYEVELERDGADYRASVDGQAYPVEVLDSQPGQISLRFGDRPVTIYWAGGEESQKWLSLDGCFYRLEKPAPKRARAAGENATGGQTVRSPMPAQVRAVQVAEGERVEKGQTLLLLEAMKMEIRVKAPVAGKVTRMLVKEGQAVEKEQILAEVEE